jgi:hypothetical protein
MNHADDNDEVVCGSCGTTISNADELDTHKHGKR